MNIFLGLLWPSQLCDGTVIIFRGREFIYSFIFFNMRLSFMRLHYEVHV